MLQIYLTIIQRQVNLCKAHRTLYKTFHTSAPKNILGQEIQPKKFERQASKSNRLCSPLRAEAIFCLAARPNLFFWAAKAFAGGAGCIEQPIFKQLSSSQTKNPLAARYLIGCCQYNFLVGFFWLYKMGLKKKAFGAHAQAYPQQKLFLAVPSYKSKPLYGSFFLEKKQPSYLKERSKTLLCLSMPKSGQMTTKLQLTKTTLSSLDNKISLFYKSKKAIKNVIDIVPISKKEISKLISSQTKFAFSSKLKKSEPQSSKIFVSNKISERKPALANSLRGYPTASQTVLFSPAQTFSLDAQHFIGTLEKMAKNTNTVKLKSSLPSLFRISTPAQQKSRPLKNLDCFGAQNFSKNRLLDILKRNKIGCSPVLVCKGFTEPLQRRVPVQDNFLAKNNKLSSNQYNFLAKIIYCLAAQAEEPFKEVATPLKIIKEYNLETYHRSNQDTCLIQKPIVKDGDWVQVGDLLADCASSVGGELAIGHNIIVAYMPWEGYNYEDAILINERLVYDDIFTSIHIERYEVKTNDTKLGSEQITRAIPDIDESEIRHLDKNGIANIGSWVEEGDILVGKITPFNIKTLTPQQKLLYKIFNKELSTTKDSSLRAPKGIKANVINVNILARQKIKIQTNKQTKNLLAPKKSNSSEPKKKLLRTLKTKVDMISIKHVHIYLAEKRKIQVGDKMAGRHGNKGIISRILPRQDMPFLPDGTFVDIVLNPLGVPSRMNVGQIYECLLGLAGLYLGEHYKIPPFDEKYGADASRSFVLSKLYEARIKTGLKWLLDPNNPGKIKIFDGRTSECFDQSVTVGIAYVLKLVHMVDDKIHARSTGPYSLVTQQPLRGRSKQGGQRLGEMEVWAIEGYGAAFVLSEMLTIKSDDMTGRQNLWKNLIQNNNISLGSPESFKVLVCELQALCLDIGLFRRNKTREKLKTEPSLIVIDSLLHLA
uniref:DNA-directed RNA polymerase n=1 Tax=Volvulina compacta TaxID=51721 RepID=A0A6C0RV63_9CHLO|nr:beta subunit of RNA polymerase [Volvulina compacta]